LPNPDSFLAQFFPENYDAILAAMQPYRLQGKRVWARWWAALALFAFVWLEAPRRLRSFVAMVELVLAYHAVLISGLIFSEPRYVFFVAPLFSLITGLLAAILWRGFRSLEGVPARAGFAIIVLGVPLLPGLATHLWADTAWAGRYYASPDLSGKPVVMHEDPVVTFEWGAKAPSEALPADGFSVRWTRTEVFEGQAYEFAVRADDGVRVYLDGKLIIDQWGEGAHDWTVVQMPLAAGRHRLAVEYFEAAGDAFVQFGYYPTP
jgi:hypothetical protein